MALTLKRLSADVRGNLHQFEVWQVTLDSSYPTHGYAITPAQLGHTSIVSVIPAPAAAPAGATAVDLQWDQTNSKLIAFWGVDAAVEVNGPLAEVAPTTDLHTYVSQVIIVAAGL